MIIDFFITQQYWWPRQPQPGGHRRTSENFSRSRSFTRPGLWDLWRRSRDHIGPWQCLGRSSQAHICDKRGRETNLFPSRGGGTFGVFGRHHASPCLLCSRLWRCNPEHSRWTDTDRVPGEVPVDLGGGVEGRPQRGPVDRPADLHPQPDPLHADCRPAGEDFCSAEELRPEENAAGQREVDDSPLRGDGQRPFLSLVCCPVPPLGCLRQGQCFRKYNQVCRQGSWCCLWDPDRGESACNSCEDEEVLHPSGWSSSCVQPNQLYRELQALWELDANMPAQVWFWGIPARPRILPHGRLPCMPPPPHPRQKCLLRPLVRERQDNWKNGEAWLHLCYPDCHRQLQIHHASHRASRDAPLPVQVAHISAVHVAGVCGLLPDGGGEATTMWSLPGSSESLSLGFSPSQVASFCNFAWNRTWLAYPGGWNSFLLLSFSIFNFHLMNPILPPLMLLLIWTNETSGFWALCCLLSTAVKVVRHHCGNFFCCSCFISFIHWKSCLTQISLWKGEQVASLGEKGGGSAFHPDRSHLLEIILSTWVNSSNSIDRPMHEVKLSVIELHMNLWY